MKNLTLYFAVFAVVIACNHPNPDRDKTPEPAVIANDSIYGTVIVTTQNELGRSWEVQSQGVKVTLTEVPKTIYEKAKGLEKNQLLGMETIHPAVSQYENCWELKPKSGAKVTLCPNEAAQITKVNYLGYQELLGLCIFREYLMESTPNFLLIDPNHRQIQRIRGRAFHLSPNGMHLISLGNDQIDWVGFDVYAVDAGQLTEVATNSMDEPPYRGDAITFDPNSLLWVSDDEAYVSNDGDAAAEIYYRIIIRKV